MSDNESDNSYIWVILVLSLILGIIFFFSKDIWPQLTSPVLRCLVAPLAGVVLFIGYYFLYVVLPNVAFQIIWKICLWISTPRFVFPVSFLIAAATGVALLFQWVSTPLVPLWALIASIAIGIVGGFIAARFSRIIRSDSWVLQSVVSLPVLIGLSYWVSIMLQPALGIWLIITIIIVAALFLIRFLYEEHQYAQRPVRSSYHQSVNPSYLPQDMKDMVLRQVRDKLGSAQYNQLVSTVGEDEIIKQVLANMQKSS